ncbi:EcsC family protein [Natribacillus halophilus]|uniref:EcsC protein family protein n=1 Tax=Natribacillus halophilus TaxID=549003 RepID=A0A1G8NDW5_9BACI|nr:EcsC family protein [Natribacillus halophilus]SDI78286.1 EcsC protein family protein [Natribacillus halophilus]
MSSSPEHIQQRLEAIQEWENRYFEGSNAEAWAMQKWQTEALARMPEKWHEKLLDGVDRFLFYTQSMILNSNVQRETEERVLVTARVFQDDINGINDVRKLRVEENQFILSQLMAKQRLLAFGQGGVTGFAGPFLLASDMPLLMAINLRTVQLSALAFGYDLRHPAEMMIALKVFQVGSSPYFMQYPGWKELETETENIVGEFYNGQERVIDEKWLQQPLRQVGKLAMIAMLRKRLIQGVPLVGVAYGAYSNYRLTRQVSEIASAYYEKRYLLDRQHNG